MNTRILVASAFAAATAVALVREGLIVDMTIPERANDGRNLH